MLHVYKTSNKPPQEKVKEIPHHSNNVMLWRHPEQEEEAFTKIRHFSIYSSQYFFNNLVFDFYWTSLVRHLTFGDGIQNPSMNKYFMNV